jgi:DNA-binding response OmpR family regulator
MTKTKKKILVVEDETILLKALNISLLQSGYEVFSAEDGEAGLKLAKDKKPDLILLDIMLPKKDGFEVLKDLKKTSSTKSIPVIILSNLGQDTDIKKGLGLGAKDYLIKADIGIESIEKRIKKFLK